MHVAQLCHPSYAILLGRSQSNSLRFTYLTHSPPYKSRHGGVLQRLVFRKASMDTDKPWDLVGLFSAIVYTAMFRQWHIENSDANWVFCSWLKFSCGYQL